MFLGKSLYQLDNKSRLTIPAKHRDLLAPAVVVTRHPSEDCLLLLPLNEWQRLADKIASLPLVDAKSALLRRKVFSNAEDIKADAQGRILISQALREHARIDGAVLIVGQYNYIELWNPELWGQRVERQFDDVDLNAEVFGALGI